MLRYECRRVNWKGRQRVWGVLCAHLLLECRQESGGKGDGCRKALLGVREARSGEMGNAARTRCDASGAGALKERRRLGARTHVPACTLAAFHARQARHRRSRSLELVHFHLRHALFPHALVSYTP